MPKAGSARKGFGETRPPLRGPVSGSDHRDMV